MKEVFIFFACFYIFQISQAQSVWAPIGATWYYQENYYTSADTGFALFSVDSDTTILGKTCSVIKGKHEFWYLPGNDSIAITYKKNDTVYIFDRYTNLFTPVFFYNTNPTDVWNVTWHNCSYNYFVDSVKLMNLNGFIHKVFYLFEQNNWIHYIVIEGHRLFVSRYFSIWKFIL